MWLISCGIDPKITLPERSKINSWLQFKRPLGNSPLSPLLASSIPRTLPNVFQQVTPTYPQIEPSVRLSKVQEGVMLLRGSSKESGIDFKQEISLKLPELRLNVPGNDQTRIWNKTKALVLRTIWVRDFSSMTIDMK